MFYRPLKGRPTEVERFAGALEAMADDKIGNIAEAIPLEWRTDKLPRIVRHLKLLRDHAKDFAEQVKRRLV